MTTVQVTTPTDLEIVMTRAFQALGRLVFDAWTRPELLTRWYGAHGWDLVVCEVDLRVGGAWRFVWRGPDGSRLGAGGTYVEITPPDRLVYTESFEDHWYPGESLVSHAFTEHSGITTLTSTLRFASREVRDLVIRSPMDRGVAEGYERLDRLLVGAAVSDDYAVHANEERKDV
jgi:uncharacterized protein YndB with AHSA1/START domain